MHDQPRKLPVLYVSESLRDEICDGRNWRLTKWTIEQCRVTTAENFKLVRLEPAVPRCKTCTEWTHGEMFNDDGTRYGFESTCDKTGEDVPENGSGYCWLHPEAYRAQ